MKMEFAFDFHWTVKRRSRNLTISLQCVSVAGGVKSAINCDGQEEYRSLPQFAAIEIAAASGGRKCRLLAVHVQGHAHDSHKRSQPQALSGTVYSHFSIRIDIPEASGLAARDGEHCGWTCGCCVQSQAPVKLRWQLRSG